MACGTITYIHLQPENDNAIGDAMATCRGFSTISNALITPYNLANVRYKFRCRAHLKHIFLKDHVRNERNRLAAIGSCGII